MRCAGPPGPCRPWHRPDPPRFDRPGSVAALGDLHVLINNAGGWTPGEQYPAATAYAWAGTIRLNLLAPIREGRPGAIVEMLRG
jgi:hypothetical protein